MGQVAHCQFCGRMCQLNGYDRAICETEERADQCEDGKDRLLNSLYSRLSRLKPSELRKLWTKAFGS